MTTRFPRRVFDHGEEPDPRFSMANERTFLAWIRTALALMAAGVAVEALDVPLGPTARFVAALVLVLSGIAAGLQAWFGWVGTERAMRQHSPLPSAPLKPLVALGLVLAGAAIAVGLSR